MPLYLPPAAASGGSISITDGTTTVDPATTLRLPAGTLTDLGGGEGGMGLLLHVLTYDFTYATPNIDTTGVVAFTLPVGAYLLDLYISCPVKWEPSSTASAPVSVSLVSHADPNTTDPVTLFSTSPDLTGMEQSGTVSDAQSGNTGDAVIEASVAADGFRTVPRLMSIAADVLVSVNAINGPITSGTASLHAIIATPAT